VVALNVVIAGGNFAWSRRTNPGVIPATYEYTGFDSITAIKEGRHAIGRPFDSIRGRRRTA
jgi:hypothetical protein